MRKVNVVTHTLEGFGVNPSDLSGAFTNYWVSAHTPSIGASGVKYYFRILPPETESFVIKLGNEWAIPNVTYIVDVSDFLKFKLYKVEEELLEIYSGSFSNVYDNYADADNDIMNYKLASNQIDIHLTTGEYCLEIWGKQTVQFVSQVSKKDVIIESYQDIKGTSGCYIYFNEFDRWLPIFPYLKINEKYIPLDLYLKIDGKYRKAYVDL